MMRLWPLSELLVLLTWLVSPLLNSLKLSHPTHPSPRLLERNIPLRLLISLLPHVVDQELMIMIIMIISVPLHWRDLEDPVSMRLHPLSMLNTWNVNKELRIYQDPWLMNHPLEL